MTDVIRETELESLLEASKQTIQNEDYVPIEDGGFEREMEDCTETSDREQQLCELQRYVRCLVDLNITLAYPIPDPQFNKQPSIIRVDALPPHHFYASKIRDRFPLADTELVEHLGKANLERYMFVTRRKERSQQEEQEGTAVDTEWDTRSKLSSFQKTAFHDSGIGSSIPTTSVPLTEAAPSVWSSATHKTNTHFSGLSRDALIGKHFQCVGCGQRIIMTRTSQWRKHLIYDTQPYTCIVPECSTTVARFPTLQSWSDHILQEHHDAVARAMQCPLCQKTWDKTKYTSLVHIGEHLEEIAMAVLPYSDQFDETDDDASEDTKLNTKAQQIDVVGVPGPHDNSAQTDDTPSALTYYGYLFGRDKTPTVILDRLLQSIALYVINNIGDRNVQALTPHKLAAFYRAVGGDYNDLFLQAPYDSISYIWQTTGCQHTLLPPEDDFAAPSVPALTLRGFVRWQAIEILLGPEEQVPFIQFALRHWSLKDPVTGGPFPVDLPPQCFPDKPDPEVEKWHKAYAEELRRKAVLKDDEPPVSEGRTLRWFAPPGNPEDG